MFFLGIWESEIGFLIEQPFSFVFERTTETITYLIKHNLQLIRVDRRYIYVKKSEKLKLQEINYFPPLWCIKFFTKRYTIKNYLKASDLFSSMDTAISYQFLKNAVSIEICNSLILISSAREIQVQVQWDDVMLLLLWLHVFNWTMAFGKVDVDYSFSSHPFKKEKIVRLKELTFVKFLKITRLLHKFDDNIFFIINDEKTFHLLNYIVLISNNKTNCSGITRNSFSIRTKAFNIFK